MSVISILPQVQEHMPKSGLLQSGAITLYMMYLTWSAMANSPYPVRGGDLTPTNVGVAGGARSLSVATLVAVSEGRGVDVWVDIRFSYH